jgi:hypothetical protein
LFDVVLRHVWVRDPRRARVVRQLAGRCGGKERQCDEKITAVPMHDFLPWKERGAYTLRTTVAAAGWERLVHLARSAPEETDRGERQIGVERLLRSRELREPALVRDTLTQ